ncbi:MAG: hypothetical protein KGJ58_00925 [Patescibacteria group bacterium]|nr:hypothetical protein [Patescibacteria group bacterium]MDE1988136.1 hypothetical protein [Patescibacteria group bacterium]MDE2218004.1 hypothetical protein [Patescibacteria group bacterium]
MKMEKEMPARNQAIDRIAKLVEMTDLATKRIRFEPLLSKSHNYNEDYASRIRRDNSRRELYKDLVSLLAEEHAFLLSKEKVSAPFFSINGFPSAGSWKADLETLVREGHPFQFPTIEDGDWITIHGENKSFIRARYDYQSDNLLLCDEVRSFLVVRADKNTDNNKDYSKLLGSSSFWWEFCRSKNNCLSLSIEISKIGKSHGERTDIFGNDSCFLEIMTKDFPTFLTLESRFFDRLCSTIIEVTKIFNSNLNRNRSWFGIAKEIADILKNCNLPKNIQSTIVKAACHCLNNDAANYLKILISKGGENATNSNNTKGK